MLSLSPSHTAVCSGIAAPGEPSACARPHVMPTRIPRQRVQRMLTAAGRRRDVRRGGTRWVAVLVLCFPHGSDSWIHSTGSTNRFDCFAGRGGLRPGITTVGNFATMLVGEGWGEEYVRIAGSPYQGNCKASWNHTQRQKIGGKKSSYGPPLC